MKKIQKICLFGVFFILGLVSEYSFGSCHVIPDCADPNIPRQSECTGLEQILNHMQQAAQSLDSFQAGLDYLFIQYPKLLDAKSLRRGTIYYARGNQKSHLRITFNTLQQDDEDPIVQPEHYLFDGVWLTKIDMKLETADFYQKAPADQPVGVFEFISHNFPMVGFTDPKKLEKEFVLTLDTCSSEPNQPQHLFLDVREDSMYKEDYTRIEVWVNSRTWLPVRLTAVTVQGDLYDLKWHNLQINKKIPEDVFTIEIPAHFSKNRHPLEK